MGIKHIEKIENMLKNSNEFFSFTKIKRKLSTDHNVTKEAIEYMKKKNEIKEKKGFDGITRYGWNHEKD